MILAVAAILVASAFTASAEGQQRLLGQNYPVVESVTGQTAGDRIFGQNYDEEFCARAFEERVKAQSTGVWEMTGRYPCHLYPTSG